MTRARTPAKQRFERRHYSPELGTEICDRIAAGELLAQIERDPAMPSRVTVWRWTRDIPEFRQMHTQAREVQALGWVEELIEIADGCAPDPAALAKARLGIDTRKWIIAKHLPRLYGDRPDPFTPAIEDQSASGDWWRALSVEEMRELRDANAVIVRLRAKAMRARDQNARPCESETRARVEIPQCRQATAAILPTVHRKQNQLG